MPTNKVKYGLKKAYYAVLTDDGLGNITFATPVAIPGAVSMSLAQQGEQNKFYADDIAYFVSSSNDGYQGDMEFALIPESFKKDVLGETLDGTDKILIEKNTAEPKQFALLFEFDGDAKATRHILYNCTCNRPSVASSTKTNTTTPATETLTITAAALPDGTVKASTTEATPDATYNAWYTSVWTE